MKHSISTSSPSKGAGKKRRFLTAEKKFQIYLEAQESDKPVGEILRREGLFSTDLARIRQQVKEGARQCLALPMLLYITRLRLKYEGGKRRFELK